jgi:predicted PurR-regulated permease PerM
VTTRRGEPPEEPDTTATEAEERRSGERRRQPIATFWGWLRRTARLWGFLAFIFVILAIFRSVILPFVLALLVAYVLAPLIRHLGALSLGGRKLPRFAWVIAVYVVLLALMALFFTAFVPRLSEDFKRILAEAPSMMKKARTTYVPAVSSWIQQNFGELEAGSTRPENAPPKASKRQAEPKVLVKRLESGEVELKVQDLKLEVIQGEEGRWSVQVADPSSAQPPGKGGIAGSVDGYLRDFVTRSEGHLKRVVQLGQKFLLGVLKMITTFILVLMISAFLLVDTERILRWFRNLVPRIYFQDFDNVIKLIDKGLSGAIRGQFIICIINGVLTGIGLWIFDVKYPLLLALLAGVMSLIPIFGSILSSIPIVLVALASGEEGVSVVKGVLILAWIIMIHLVEANLLNPKIMGTAAKIHPVIVIFAVVAGERTYGPMGALLGVPLVSAIQAVFIYLRRKVRGEIDEQGRSKSPPGKSSEAPAQS